MYGKYYTDLRSKIQEKRSGGVKATAETQVAESEARRALGQRQAESQKERFRDKAENLQVASNDDSMFGWMESIYDSWAPEEETPAKDTPVRMGTTGQSGSDYYRGTPFKGTLIDMMDAKEGGGNYDMLFGGAQGEGKRFAGIKATEMTIGQLKAFTNISGEYGQWLKGSLAKSGQRARVSTPIGRYQIVGKTLAGAAAAMGLSDDTVFTPEVQDAMFRHIAKEAGPAGLKGQWEGFANIPQSQLNIAYDEMFGSPTGMSSPIPKKRPLVAKKGI